MARYRVGDSETDSVVRARLMAVAEIGDGSVFRAVPVFCGSRCGWVIREEEYMEWSDFSGARYELDPGTGGCTPL